MINNIPKDNKLILFILQFIGLLTLTSVPRQISPIVILVIILSMMKICEQDLKLSVRFISPFFIMLIIGLLVGFQQGMRDQLRDIGLGILFLSSIYLGLISSDQLGKQSYLSFIFLSIFAVISNIAKLLTINSFDLVTIRETTPGIFELFIILIILLVYKKEFLPKRFLGLPAFVIVIALPVTLITQSRTVLAQVLIFFISKYMYERKNKLKALLIASSLTVIVFGFIWTQGKTADPYTFLGKLARVNSEIVPVSSNLEDLDINQDWRAVETLIALNQIKNSDTLHILLGSGMGSRVSLGFEMPLGDSTLDSIPYFHNGYIYLLFKYGVVGLLLFALLIYSFLKQLRRIKSSSPNKYFVGVSCILMILVSQVFSSGVVQNSQLLLVVFLSSILRDCQNISKTPIHIKKSENIVNHLVSKC